METRFELNGEAAKVESHKLAARKCVAYVRYEDDGMVLHTETAATEQEAFQKARRWAEQKIGRPLN